MYLISVYFPFAFLYTMDHKDLIISTLDKLRMNEMHSFDPSAKFKVIAYNKAIASIRGMARAIHSIEDVKGLPGIGPKISAKIDEIIETGRLRAAATRAASVEHLMKVHGIGPVKAHDLIMFGIQDIATLRAAVHSNPAILNKTQTIGLRHYEDGCLRIPRAEIEEHNIQLSSSIKSPLKYTIAGSYRRGAETSGDIDVLISYDHIEDDRASIEFQNIITNMESRGYIIDTLVRGDTKWMGYVRLRPDLPARRLDLLLVPPESYPYAILYFTGSDKFNVAMRGYCHTLGYSLNEHCLSHRYSGDPCMTVMTCEEDIFEFLGLKYIHPHERIDARQIITT